MILGLRKKIPVALLMDWPFGPQAPLRSVTPGNDPPSGSGHASGSTRSMYLDRATGLTPYVLERAPGAPDCAEINGGELRHGYNDTGCSVDGSPATDAAVRTAAPGLRD